MRYPRFGCLFLTFILPFIFKCSEGNCQQSVDTSFTLHSFEPHYPKAEGPVVYIDASHNNLHTLAGGFAPFGKVLELDGYKVGELDDWSKLDFSEKEINILVVVNPLHDSNIGNWVLPNPNAFTEEEIVILVDWVNSGGRLLLIADHMPYAGAAFELGKAFGVDFLNGFAMGQERSWPPDLFTHSSGSLNTAFADTLDCTHASIDSVASFTGSAFRVDSSYRNILLLSSLHSVLLPDTAWVFDQDTPTISGNGLVQGAVRHYGEGRVAVFGEAALFTAQTINGQYKVGFTSDQAPGNLSLIRELMHWLSH